MRGFTGCAIAIGLGARIVTAACNETKLRQATDRYVASQSTGSLQWLGEVLDHDVTFLENGIVLDIHAGNTALAHPLRIDHRHSIYDLTQCASFTSLTSTNSANPMVIATQLWVGDDGSVFKIDRIVNTEGDWRFNATGTLYYTLGENWGAIPVTQRNSRETIKAAADAYLDVFKDADVPVPWGMPCARLEGGDYRVPGRANDSCSWDVTQSFDMPNRRYVIDETVGTISVLLDWGGLMLAPDSHLIRIEQGKIRLIHTLSYCETKPNCGFELAPPGVPVSAIL
jgi:hypothetical protein